MGKNLRGFYPVFYYHWQHGRFFFFIYWIKDRKSKTYKCFGLFVKFIIIKNNVNELLVSDKMSNTVNVLVPVRQTCDPRGNSEPPKKLTSGLVFHSEPWRICSFSVKLINNSLIYSKVLKICSFIQGTCDLHIPVVN